MVCPFHYIIDCAKCFKNDFSTPSTGTSRTRTFVFDLMYFFGYSQREVLSAKVHNHLTYNVQGMLDYDLTIHYHWNDCKPDRYGA